MSIIRQACQLILQDSKSLEIRNPEIYISGPITGIEKLNKPAFLLAEHFLKENGFKPINPHTLHGSDENIQTWDSYMRTDIKHLTTCGACIMLPNWSNSVGATFEFITAKTLNIPVIDREFRLLLVTKGELRQLFEKIITKIEALDFEQKWF